MMLDEENKAHFPVVRNVDVTGVSPTQRDPDSWKLCTVVYCSRIVVLKNNMVLDQVLSVVPRFVVPKCVQVQH